ncbi:hypothetical protein MAUB1S_02390 [Mycolicibacterium aubagnense]
MLPVIMTRVVGGEDALVAALKRGDEAAFAELVDRHTPALLRVAHGYVPTREIAEDVVQDTWIALLKGIGSFEGRSSLRAWLFAILINIAKNRGVRERRDADLAVTAFTGELSTPRAFAALTTRTPAIGCRPPYRHHSRTLPRALSWVRN